MTTTVNISLPQEMYKDAKKAAKERKYSSISELVRDALRRIIYSKEEITENGFPRWFEDKVLEAEREPEENDIVLKTEKDIHNYFLHLKKPRSKKK